MIEAVNVTEPAGDRDLLRGVAAPTHATGTAVVDLERPFLELGVRFAEASPFVEKGSKTEARLRHE
jgi:hypothetical protein